MMGFIESSFIDIAKRSKPIFQQQKSHQLLITSAHFFALIWNCQLCIGLQWPASTPSAMCPSTTWASVDNTTCLVHGAAAYLHRTWCCGAGKPEHYIISEPIQLFFVINYAS